MIEPGTPHRAHIIHFTEVVPTSWVEVGVVGGWQRTYGGTEPLATQSIAHVKPRPRFTGCNAGHTFLNVDPHGLASICKVARDQQINLMTEGAAGLTRLGGIADALMLRTGGCSGCQLAEQCSVCRPLAKLYQEAKAPLNRYCQHAERRTHA